jgi:hypothetical protein
MKNRNGTLGGGDFYSGRVEAMKGSAFVHSGPAAHTKDRPVLSSERVPHGNKNKE